MKLLLDKKYIDILDSLGYKISDESNLKWMDVFLWISENTDILISVERIQQPERHLDKSVIVYYGFKLTVKVCETDNVEDGIIMGIKYVLDKSNLELFKQHYNNVQSE
jgi:hypothetical protein